MTRVVAVIQARMGSSRLPGKVLMPLAGKPVLWHVIHRLRKCRTVDAIAIATSVNSADDPIAAFGLEEGVAVIRGSEDNVLLRYAAAAEQLRADIVVRVTGDAPLIDPAMTDLQVKTLAQTGADFCVPDPQTPYIYEGVDPLTTRALQRLVSEVGDDPVAREHVTAYFKQHPDFARIAYVPVEPAYHFAGARVSVDTPADLHFQDVLYARLGVPAGEADLRAVADLLRQDPALLTINAHVQRKALGYSNRRVLLRCDGSAQLGLGHVYRCLALADELRDVHGWGVVFAMADSSLGTEVATRAGYHVERKCGEVEDAWLEDLASRQRPDVLVLDVRSDLARSTLDGIRKAGVMVVTLDDPSERRLSTDLAFYPPVPQVRRMDWTGFMGELHVGWEWVVLRRGFRKGPTCMRQDQPVVLVTMGGTDPADLTSRVVEALDLLTDQFRSIVVLGPGYSRQDAVADLAASSPGRFEIRRSVEDMPSLMARVDLAVASFGVTAYELAAIGVPAIHLCLSPDHAESSAAFAEAGLAVNLGVYSQVTTEAMAEVICRLLHDQPRRAEMSARARRHVDGLGAARVASAMVERLGRNCG